MRWGTLPGLVDIFTDATEKMADAVDLAAVTAINNDVDSRITSLGSDNAALRAMSAGPLADMAKVIPACRQVSALASTS